MGATTTVDVALRPATVSEEVTVTAEAPLIDTARTDVSSVVSETAIQNLPINGRRWENFVLLSPGVTNDGNFGLVSYRGISGLYNNNTVDGVDNNQAFFSEARGRTRASYTISQAAIREFQVGVSNFSAEFGRAAGGTVNAVTKSGTNEFHGEAFYFLRDDAFQAREPFYPKTAPKPEERRHQFGLSMGGPLKKDKAFFFFNYDEQRRNFPYFVNFVERDLPRPGLHRSGLRGHAHFFQQETLTPVPREGNNRIFLGKVDVALNSKHTLSLQYNCHRWDAPNGVRTPALNAERAHGQRHGHREDRLRPAHPELGVQPQAPQRAARADRAATSSSRSPTRRARAPRVTGGFSYRHAELPASPQVPGRAPLPGARRGDLLHAARTASRSAWTSTTCARTSRTCSRAAACTRYASLQNISADCPPDASRMRAAGRRRPRPPLPELRAGVRPARRPQRRRAVQHHRLQLLHPGHLAREPRR